MPVETKQEFFGPGIGVEIGKIQPELKKLWQESDKVATRASRLNLVIHSAAEHSIRANTEVVEKITHQHALRAILVAAKANMPGHRVRSWINAHCQISKSGAKQRCSEQIAFQLEGTAAAPKIVANIVFSHLDSDLPLYLWWQGEFPPAPDHGLMAWVDRLIFDSADWTDAAAQFRILETICTEHPHLETALGDLNWTRLTGMRYAVAQFFDPPGARAMLPELNSVDITHGPGSRLSALLLAAWLGRQLGWTPVKAPGQPPSFEGGTGDKISLALKESAEASAAIERVILRTAAGAEFTVIRPPGSALLNTRACLLPNECEVSQVLPAGTDDIAEQVSHELTHSGRHRTYLRVIETLRRLLES